MSKAKAPLVETQMMIRRPVGEVFGAFIHPEVTTNFWFTKSSGPLEKGKKVLWEWEMYQVATQVEVLDIIPDTLISTRWGEPPTLVDYGFTPLGTDSTYVVIRNHGFVAQGEALIRELMDSTGGFTTVLDGLKAYLEHGIKLNLIGDKFPPQAPRENPMDDHMGTG